MRKPPWGPLHHRDDEEPDEVNVVHPIDYFLYTHSTDCKFCGQDGHSGKNCPNKPTLRQP